MKQNSNGSNSKLEESRSKPFDIDLNETPLSSPRETVVIGAPADVSPELHSSQRIRAGGVAVGLLDINALPPVEEETCEFNKTGGLSASETSLIQSSSNGLATHSSLLHGGNQLDLLKASGSVASLVKSSYEDRVQQRLKFGGNLRENQNSIVRDSLRACDHSIRRAAYQKDCALDGNSSDSMFDVACHLCLVSKYHSVESQGRRDGSAMMQRGLNLSQSRENSLIFSQVNNSEECQENLKSSVSAEYPSGIEAAKNEACKLKSHMSVKQANVKENGVSDSLQTKVELPVQFEDFCILAVGEVDPRPSYHSNSQIWPVGYSSSWHDKITGSLFVCDVSDGGDFGPLFKVKRYPCSTQPIPVGSTVLLSPSYDQKVGKGQEETDDTVGMHDVDDMNIQLIFSNDSPPHLDYDGLSDLGQNIDETHNSQPMNNSETKSNCLSQSIGRPITNYKELVDDIGEFLVEGRSSSSVWRMVSQTLEHACRKVYGQTGVCRFCCKHDVIRMWSSCFASLSEESTESFDSLTKFYCLSGPINVPQNIISNDELDTSCGALIKWLDHDRFGLDVEFVQEIIEQLPQVHVCAEYVFLNKRRERSTLKTIGSGFLQVKRKSDIHEKEADSNLFRCSKRPREQISRNPAMKSCFPPGKSLSSKLPTELIGDVIQSWELLWRFSEVLGLEEPLSFKELEEELVNGYFFTLSSSTSTLQQQDEHAFIAIETEGLKEAVNIEQVSNTNSGCTGVALADVLCSLLKILLGELQSKASIFVDSNFDGGEPKSRRRRKKDADNLMSAKKIMFDLLPVNGLTWPELARRYFLTVSSMEGNLDSVDFVNRESCKAFHCFQGDSGTIHGSFPGVAGMEAEALLLAEATKQIFGSLKNTNDNSIVDYIDFNAISSSENIKVNDGGIPEWAQVLEPVRKLPTNVGARIRKCVYDALDRGPPEWARKRLEHSISKEVYKGNASGPTKKAVLSVLTDVCGESQQQKPNRKRRNRRFSSASDVIMKQCQKVLRCAAAADEEKVFCNLLGRTLLNTSDNDDEGLLGFPAMVSRPLDFRTIDLRLAFGAYSGSHEAFMEDVREVWHHIRTAYSDQSDLLELAEKLSQNFEVLYEKEVLTIAKKLRDHPNIECLNSEAKKEIEDILESASEMPKAPWDEGVCKVCGIDKDDDNVLLCDTCDSGYHTYCLSPPLARVPEGNWYCPPCATGDCNSQYTSQVPQVISRSQKRRYQGEFTRGILESLSQLSTTMETRDYWEYSTKERIHLLKFLCDELLNSVNIREHLEHCTSVSVDLQQKLRSSSLEWKNLKFKEEILVGKVARVNTSVISANGKSEAEGVATLQTNYSAMRQPPRSSYFSSVPTELVPGDGWNMYGANNFWKQPCWFYSKGTSVRKPVCSGNQIGKAPCTGLHVRQQLDTSLRIDNPQNKLSIPTQPQTHDPRVKDACWTNFDKQPELQKGDNDSPMLPNTEASIGNISSDTMRNHVADHIQAMPMISENQFLDHISQHDMNELLAFELKVNPLKKEIDVLRDSIACLESQLQAVSLRKELLGKDSAGRFYWAFSRPSTSPWLLVEGGTMLQQRSLVRGHGISLADKSIVRYSSLYEMENSGMASSSWFSYQSSAEIKELIEWLEDSDPTDREVADSILHWQKIGNMDSDKAENCVQYENQPSSLKGISSEASVNSNGLVTKALIVLEKKHGPCLEVGTSKIRIKQDQNAELIQKEIMYRCDCLEPVWPSRFHCCCCHLSFSSRYDFEEHNGCIRNPGETSSQKKADDDATRGKRMTRTQTLHGENKENVGNGASGNLKHEIGFGLFQFPKELACPYDIEEISAKFVTKNSIKELVQEIGMIGLNGVPSFVPSTSPYLSDPSLKLVHLCSNGVTKGDNSINVDSSVPQNMKSSLKHGNNFKNSATRIVSGNDEEVLKSRKLNPNLMNERREQSYLKYRGSKLGIANCSIIHDCSLRTIMGRGIEILRYLKINLLDMDAAVPEEALRSSKASWKKRCAWRAFVKSSKSIFEMVQATIVFEDMIKTDYLRNGWWYWSSLSAAAKIATISSLALRIYALDAAIIYDKSSALSASTEILEHSSMSNKNTLSAKDSTNNTKPSKPVPKTPSSDLTDFCKLRNKSSRKRKDLGG